jgi:hypothetical protein
MVCQVGDKLAEGAWVTDTWSLLTMAILAFLYATAVRKSERGFIHRTGTVCNTERG